MIDIKGEGRGFFKGRFFKVIIFIVIFLVGFMTSLFFGSATPADKSFIGLVATPFQSVGAKVRGAFQGFFDTFASYQALEQENEQLRVQVAQLQSQLQENYYLESENDRLRRLLSLQEEYPEFEFADADVVSRSTDGWSSSMTLNVGTNQGVQKKNIVVTPDGLVGIVSDVGLNWATVTTIIDVQIGVGAMIESTHDIGMIEGTTALKSDGLCQLSYIDNNVSISRGDIVKTSGLGGTYPKDLTIGTIVDVVTEEHGLSMYAVVQPSVDIQSVKRVYVITNFDNEGILDEN